MALHRRRQPRRRLWRPSVRAGPVAWTVERKDGRIGVYNVPSSGTWTQKRTLNADGTTTGRLHVPAGVGGPDAIDEDLSGTWSLSGTTVTFTLATSNP